MITVCDECGIELDEEDVLYECPFCGYECDEGYIQCENCKNLYALDGDMWECPNCYNGGISESFDFESRCGVEIPSNCPGCGAELDDGYCDECGWPDVNQGWFGENC